jgi:hypothetical protein
MDAAVNGRLSPDLLRHESFGHKRIVDAPSDVVSSEE